MFDMGNLCIFLETILTKCLQIIIIIWIHLVSFSPVPLFQAKLSSQNLGLHEISTLLLSLFAYTFFLQLAGGRDFVNNFVQILTFMNPNIDSNHFEPISIFAATLIGIINFTKI